MAYIVMASIVMARIGMVCIGMACLVMAYDSDHRWCRVEPFMTACTVTAYIVMAETVMTLAVGG